MTIQRAMRTHGRTTQASLLVTLKLKVCVNNKQKRTWPQCTALDKNLDSLQIV